MSKKLNVEIKAKCADQEKIRKILKSKNADYKGIDHQVDTYFNCSNGRLKLRSGNIENSLIFYKRSNQEGPKVSDIFLEKLPPQNDISNILSSAYGIQILVDKKREIYFIENVKFHLDEVVGLGTFVEIEAIDETGDLGLEKISAQCHEYMHLFEIQQDQLLSLSYSDLVKFQNEVHNSAFNFLEKLFSLIKFDVNNFSLDHLCFRTKTNDDYQKYCSLFKGIGNLLGENLVGDRNISSFKLSTPIEYKNRLISIIEVPEPKNGSYYENGFEHAEFVIEDSFEQFAQKNSQINFDWSNANKKINPELRVKLNDNISLKFHHQSLENLIGL